MRSQFTRLLNDLFMAFHQRSVGAAAALIKAVQAEAKAQGCGVVLWIIHGHNYWVRSLYDKLAEKNWLGALWNGRSGDEMNVILTSWIAPFGVGFTLSFSLILAIGANASAYWRACAILCAV